jgi:hypothetical protein
MLCLQQLRSSVPTSPVRRCSFPPSDTDRLHSAEALRRPPLVDEDLWYRLSILASDGLYVLEAANTAYLAPQRPHTDLQKELLPLVRSLPKKCTDITRPRPPMLESSHSTLPQVPTEVPLPQSPTPIFLFDCPQVHPKT